MTLLDDDIDDLLQAFRADEAHIDDDIRNRIWTRICDEAPDAPTTLDTLDPQARVRQLRHRAHTPHRARMLAVAAAVLVLVAVAGLAVRSGQDDAAVTAGPSTTIPAPRDLDELADRVAAMTPTVLGTTPDATYTYRHATRSQRTGPTGATSVRDEQLWIALDGSGREALDVEGVDRDRDETTDEAGSHDIGFLPPRTAVDLPDDADAVLATFARRTGAVGPEAAPELVDLLTYTGLPAQARAGALRALGRLGFAAVPDADPGPNLWRVEGSGPDGSTMQADFDLRTGGVTVWAHLAPDGTSTRLTDIEVDLRPDTRGS